nr:MAG TPA: hypothetical protein [Caudoviricetes sp.]
MLKKYHFPFRTQTHSFLLVQSITGWKIKHMGLAI